MQVGLYTGDSIPINTEQAPLDKFINFFQTFPSIKFGQCPFQMTMVRLNQIPYVCVCVCVCVCVSVCRSLSWRPCSNLPGFPGPTEIGS